MAMHATWSQATGVQVAAGFTAQMVPGRSARAIAAPLGAVPVA